MITGAVQFNVNSGSRRSVVSIAIEGGEFQDWRPSLLKQDIMQKRS